MLFGVIGNQAGDADSIVSAIAMAYLKHLQSGRMDEYIPFVQFRIEDLPSRLDFMAIYKIATTTGQDMQTEMGIRSIRDQCGKIPSHWILVDQMGIRSICERSGQIPSHWILVDHNEPTTSAISNVTEIYDHHEIMTDSARQLSLHVSDIRTVGSCCTIIADHWLRYLAETSTSTEDMKITQILYMLLLTIILDTGNLSESMGKTTATDWEVVQRLTVYLDIPCAADWMTCQFNKIMEEKFDKKFWYSRKFSAILKYDYKEYSIASKSTTINVSPVVGMSTILRRLEGMEFPWDRPDGLHVVITGYPREDGRGLNRELLIHGLDRESDSSIFDRLISRFSLVPLPGEYPGEAFKVFDESFSRKKFAPFFINLLESKN